MIEQKQGQTQETQEYNFDLQKFSADKSDTETELKQLCYCLMEIQKLKEKLQHNTTAKSLLNETIKKFETQIEINAEILREIQDSIVSVELRIQKFKPSDNKTETYLTTQATTSDNKEQQTATKTTKRYDLCPDCEGKLFQNVIRNQDGEIEDIELECLNENCNYIRSVY
jgi:ribosomal protein S6